ncbi:hypothetical protein [Acinetobacter beijerinckii]|uniref:hypothetical protein n=1 Tax=Acinetobacter beijerinckii TaxID=262668 RepID=UPI000AB77AA1|nr:hypothetical protein [Acinetobacter beijerinckii]
MKNTQALKIKKGDLVIVDFISESRTIYSGKRFTGYGVEDGYVFGQLEQGTPFMCPEQFVQLTSAEIIKQIRAEFETWLKKQKQYSVLINQHGADLFNYDSIDGYQKLAVVLAFELWKELSLSRDTNKALLKKLNVSSATFTNGGTHHE